MSQSFTIYFGAVDKLGQGARSQGNFTGSEALAISWATKRARAPGGSYESILLVDQETSERCWIVMNGDGFERRPA